MAAKKVDSKTQKKPTDKSTKKKDQKKWVKTTTKEKVLKNVILDEEIFSKVKKEVVNMTVVTPSNLASKHNFSNSLAKQILDEVVKTGEIEVISKSSFGTIYGKKVVAEEKTAAPEVVTSSA
ncbi:small subunit ribosomal protein S25e [Nematocida homosporus]|uniref:small subunit ribosomal protein S25e n=1 Tax=Nematocida homosporus TaxID=1912981 RepID=UPI00222109A7|nr:small subunit ribosomal protein S25e [Nematocida homosporus]KAI5187411.1 small subunit ribosomal protein S25e [Nematocida homosporus]